MRRCRRSGSKTVPPPFPCRVEGARTPAILDEGRLATFVHKSRGARGWKRLQVCLGLSSAPDVAQTECANWNQDPQPFHCAGYGRNSEIAAAWGTASAVAGTLVEGIADILAR